jgi:hypothetical protein
MENLLPRKLQAKRAKTTPPMAPTIAEFAIILLADDEGVAALGRTEVPVLRVPVPVLVGDLGVVLFLSG